MLVARGRGGTIVAMRRRDLYTIGAALWLPSAKAASPASAAEFRREAKSAAPYRKPRGQRNGFDGNQMNQVMVVEKSPAIRVKLEMAGKPQAAQLPDGTIVVAGFIEPPVHEHSRCTPQYSTDNGRTFGEPRVLDVEGRSNGFRCLKDGTLILGHGGARQGISRSADGGKRGRRSTSRRTLSPATRIFVSASVTDPSNSATAHCSSIWRAPLATMNGQPT